MPSTQLQAYLKVSLALVLTQHPLTSRAASTVSHPALVTDVVTAPGLEEANNQYVGPLADAISRIDPARDGWASEVFSERAQFKLKELKHWLLQAPNSVEAPREVFAENPRLKLKPLDLQQIWENHSFSVGRAYSFGELTESNPIGALSKFIATCLDNRPAHLELKLFKVTSEPDSIRSRVYLHANGNTAGFRRQLNAEWELTWTKEPESPRLLSITAISHEQVTAKTQSETPLYTDDTAALLGNNESYHQQLLRSTDHWRKRLSRDLGLDVIGHHGIALADVNGDDLDDLYLCQQGGLPNRLYLRRPDGTLIDHTAPSNTGWLDHSTNALLIDLDNDGDRDLVVCVDKQILIMSNDGAARFELVYRSSTKAQTFSLSAADFDLDGDLDLFACGYNPNRPGQQSSIMGEPIPYHDAQNGGRNLLLRNDGNWSFKDATHESGLDQNNNRFSFASSWEDYDQDGDPDLYIANDYGRNNLYKNQDGHFVDVAADLGVEDMSAGMSATWADVNRDGHLDLYVSNMFSAAGNRIAFKRQFQPNADAQTRQNYQRHARGNSLFLGQGAEEIFLDSSEAMGVTMGRWAWGSRFTDFDQDGWQDLVVANGFITTEDTGDL